jgi:hypothetical protein
LISEWLIVELLVGVWFLIGGSNYAFYAITFAAGRVKWTIYRAEIRDAANFGIKDDESADTVLSALSSFFVMIFKCKTAMVTGKGTFCQSVLRIYCFTPFTLFHCEQQRFLAFLPFSKTLIPGSIVFVF